MTTLLVLALPVAFVAGRLVGRRERRPAVGERLLADSLVVSAGNVEPMHDKTQRPRFRSIRGGAA